MIRTDVVDLTVKIALREDVGRKDITSSCIIPEHLNIKADIEAHEAGILCGIEVAEKVFRYVDENLRFLPVAKDGEEVVAGREIAYIEGSARSILIAERTALNFLSHLSGIATLTREFVDRAKPHKVKIMDTRKTIPNMRYLEKYAVATGGGVNHRTGLYDEILIKDNHLRVLRSRSIPDIVEEAHRGVLKKTVVGVEVKNLKELAEALKSRVNYILLDNMSLEMIRECVSMRNKTNPKIELEISGGVNLETIKALSETGVDRISIGALTHSAPSLDLSLDIVG